MPTLTPERVNEIRQMASCFPFLVNEKNELCDAYLEHLQFDVALAQASAFAQYVSDHAKGEMVKAADRFLSTEGALYIEKRIAVARTVYEGEVSDELVQVGANAVFDRIGSTLDYGIIRCIIAAAFKEMVNG